MSDLNETIIEQLAEKIFEDYGSEIADRAASRVSCHADLDVKMKQLLKAKIDTLIEDQIQPIIDGSVEDYMIECLKTSFKDFDSVRDKTEAIHRYLKRHVENYLRSREGGYNNHTRKIEGLVNDSLDKHIRSIQTTFNEIVEAIIQDTITKHTVPELKKFDKLKEIFEVSYTAIEKKG